MAYEQNDNSNLLQNLAQSVDVWMVRANLKLSFEERVEQHTKNIELIDELKQFGRAHRAKTSQISDQ